MDKAKIRNSALDMCRTRPKKVPVRIATLKANIKRLAAKPKLSARAKQTVAENAYEQRILTNLHDALELGDR